MRFITCLTIVILLISIQTTLIKAFPVFTASFDLLIPFVVFLILFRSRLEIWLVIFVAGIAVNMVSGAPIGIYLITYAWLFMLFKNVKMYFHTPDSSLFVILVTIGVMIEQLIFIAFHFIQKSSLIFSMHPFQTIFTQILVVCFSSPFILMIFGKIFYVSDRFSDGDKRAASKPLWKQSKKQGPRFLL